MNPFEDPADAVQHEREYRRRLLIRGVRGWLYANRSPKLLCGALFAVCLFAASGLALILPRAGIQSWGGRAFLAILATLPLYVSLLRLAARLAFRGMDLSTCGREFVARDNVAERQRNLDEAGIAESIEDAFADDFAAEPRTALACSIGSLAFWFGWELICRSPQLLIETHVDADLLSEQPHLAETIQRLNWRAEAFALSAAYFGGMATFAAVIAEAAFYFVKFS